MTEKPFTPLATNFTHHLGTVEFITPLEMLIRVKPKHGISADLLLKSKDTIIEYMIDEGFLTEAHMKWLSRKKKRIKVFTGFST